MDLRALIDGIIERLPLEYDRKGIEATISHIERAEKYWFMAREGFDVEMYTDVVYRTNQAFEGALKEAYFVLVENAPKKVSPFEIESYLVDNEILKPKLIEAVRNYRQEWRNTSAHDYKLFFSEHEALLAIANVSTFTVMLLEQIIVKVNENIEKQRVSQMVKSIRGSISNYEKLDFNKKVYSTLASSYSNFYEVKDKLPMNQYVGKLAGFVEAVIDEASVSTDVELVSGTGLFADLLISSSTNETVVIEVKQMPKHQSLNLSHHNYVVKLLDRSGIKHGALMVVDSTSKTGSYSIQQTIFPDTSDIVTIFPTYD
ncbi:HEPN domain-containing protein [Vibrio ulleungensis]|uniref:HEPN domain-containing protein n=1 Tax=Vibrio ulleungensis TaxID=2807619 RepID=A0ABS2HJ52_9VIBR|nr:HEPN domain-containing protein [Vibrio ulleungensis]MBM7037136.1 HEPN domain-containing protein [Vibrio ulleungensis]